MPKTRIRWNAGRRASSIISAQSEKIERRKIAPRLESLEFLAAVKIDGGDRDPLHRQSLAGRPMTPHPIQVEIARLRRRAWRLAWMQAASRFAAVVVAALLLWLVSDYLFRYREPGLRAVGLAAILAAGAWAAWRFLAPMTTWRLSDVDVARRVDRRFASADRRVASALEFLAAAEGGERDADRGSARLRDAVVSDASRSLSGIKFAEVLDSRPTFQAASIALAAAGFAMLLYVVSPDAARLAIARLNPGADVPWPPRHRLVFEPEITHLAQGDAFEARVVERGGNLPDEVWIEYAATENRPAGVAADSRHLMQPLGDAMVARRENVRSSFWYRATGGDDTSMDWRRLTVVEPPRLAACRIAVHPPDYTAWPSADSPRAIRALVGSHVEIEATASRPLTTASVVLESGKRIPLAIDADGLKLSLPAGADAVADDLTWRIDDSRSYRFELAARDGTQTSAARDEQWEIQPIVDLPPVVSIEQPGDVVYATARANVAVRLAASDDLAIARVAIERRIRRGNDRPAASTAESDGSGVESFEVYAASPPSDGETGLGRWPRGDRVGPVESTWNRATRSSTRQSRGIARARKPAPRRRGSSSSRAKNSSSGQSTSKYISPNNSPAGLNWPGNRNDCSLVC
jgi:hypothetical protein